VDASNAAFFIPGYMYTYLQYMITLPPHEYEFRFQQLRDPYSLCGSRLLLALLACLSFNTNRPVEMRMRYDETRCAQQR
jgi:hypothetical protein